MALGPCSSPSIHATSRLMFRCFHWCDVKAQTLQPRGSGPVSHRPRARDQTITHSKNTSDRQTCKPSLLATLLKGEIFPPNKRCLPPVSHVFPLGGRAARPLAPWNSWTWGPGPGCSHGAAWAKDVHGPYLTLGLRLNLSHFVHWCQRWESFLF